MKDSSVQTIGYWDKKEKQSYAISTEKFKLKGADTTSHETTSCDVDITILDSTEKSYTIEWAYKNFSMNTDNEVVKKLMSLTSQDIKVIIKTDENGAFTEVVNWKEVRDYFKSAVEKIKAEFKEVPKMEAVINQISAMYSTKEAIETAAIKDIQQFYTFHGAKYKLGEALEGKIKVPNLLGGDPFDADVSMYLDTIEEGDNNYILRASQVVDKQQLRTATFALMTTLSKEMGVDPPKETELMEISHEIDTASRIHDSGWVIYSLQTQTVTADNTTNIEERVIEIK